MCALSATVCGRQTYRYMAATAEELIIFVERVLEYGTKWYRVGSGTYFEKYCRQKQVHLYMPVVFRDIVGCSGGLGQSRTKSLGLADSALREYPTMSAKSTLSGTIYTRFFVLPY